MEETKQTEWELVTEYGIPDHMCPTCAVYPQLLYNKEDEMWAIRCPMCGYQQAWGVKDFDETYIPMMARLFNVGLMSSVFNFGAQQGYIINNPCKGALYKKDKSQNKKIKYLDQEQSRKLMELTSEYSIFNTIIQVLLFTGLRIGECLCLEWDSVDFEQSTISVTQTLAYAYKEKYESCPKNLQSVRTIKVGEYTLALLKRHKEKQDENKQIVGKAWQHPNFVFTDEIGRYINYCSINVKLKKLLKENGLPIVTLHALRHTNASLMVNSGVDLKAVSAQLGHCNISITADTYGHIFDVYKAKIAKSIEDKLL